MSDVKTEVEDRLFSDPSHRAYAVLDGARWAGLRGFLEDRDAEFMCLHSGALDPEVLAVSPYVVALGDEGPLFDDVFDEVWGRARGVFVSGDGGLLDVRAHLRTLAYAQMPDGEVALFRFYDPRALSLFLSAATLAQRAAFFGGAVEQWVYEDGGAVSCLNRRPEAV